MISSKTWKSAKHHETQQKPDYQVCHTEQDPAICHEEQKEKTVCFKKNILITMTTIVVIMMMVDDMEEYNDKDA